MESHQPALRARHSTVDDLEDACFKTYRNLMETRTREPGFSDVDLQALHDQVKDVAEEEFNLSCQQFNPSQVSRAKLSLMNRIEVERKIAIERYHLSQMCATLQEGLTQAKEEYAANVVAVNQLEETREIQDAQLADNEMVLQKLDSNAALLQEQYERQERELRELEERLNCMAREKEQLAAQNEVLKEQNLKDIQQLEEMERQHAEQTSSVFDKVKSKVTGLFTRREQSPKK